MKLSSLDIAFFLAFGGVRSYKLLVKKKRKKSAVLKIIQTRPVKYLFCFVLTTFFIFLSTSLLPRAIKVNKITCKNQYGECSGQILEEIETLKNLSFFEIKKKIDKIFSEKKIVKSYSVQFKLPSNLEVYIIEKRAKFAVVSKQESLIALVDKEGEVISFSDSTNLPHILIDEKYPSLGGNIDNRLLFGLEIMFDVYSTYQVRAGYKEKDSLLIELTSGPKVIFPLEGERNLLLGSLNLIVSRLNSLEDESKIGYRNMHEKVIDLRFKNPVIR